MAQATQKGFPGFGILHTDGGQGIRVVKTFTQGPKKIIESDGSHTYLTPSPTIHELHGGGFCYASGKPVTNRTHLEAIDDPGMRERGLKWFDMHGRAISPEDVVEINPNEEKARPEPAYVVSNTVAHPDEPMEVVREKVVPAPPTPAKDNTRSEIERILAGIATNLSSLTDEVKKQGQKVVDLENLVEAKKRSMGAKKEKISQIMKAKWQDPSYRNKVVEARHPGDTPPPDKTE